MCRPARIVAAPAERHLADLTPADRGRNHLGDVPGVLIDAVAPGSMAYNMDLKPGDVILQVGDRPMTSPDEVRARDGQRSGSVPSISTAL
jgi:serine protease Do